MKHQLNKKQNLRLPNIEQIYLYDINYICDFHKFDFVFYSLPERL